MRRPGLSLFLSFLFGIILEYNQMISLTLILILLFPASVLLLYCLKKQSGISFFHIAGLFLLISFLGAGYFHFVSSHPDLLVAKEGQSCHISGRVLSIQVKSDSYFQMVVRDETAQKRIIKIYDSCTDPENLAGEYVVVQGTIILPQHQRNPGLFDYNLYLKTRGIDVIVLADHYWIVEGSDHWNRFLFYPAKLKYGFMKRLTDVMEVEQAGILAGILLGDNSMMDSETYEAFQKNGIAHVLSVSGIHVGIIYCYVSMILGRKKTLLFYIITGLVLIFYAALSEFSPSVVRAVTMIFIHMMSKITYRRYDFLSCIAASGMAMILYQPYSFLNAGFQLSFIAVFSLAFFMPLGERGLCQLEQKGTNLWIVEIWRFFLPLIVVQFGMLPLTIYLFDSISTVSLFINPVAIFLASILVPAGLCLIPLSFLGEVIFSFGAKPVAWLIDRLVFLNQLFYLPGKSFFYIPGPPLFLILCIYFFGFYFASETFRILIQRRKKIRYIGIAFILVIIAGLLSIPANEWGRDANLVFLDVGQGDCLHIRTPEGKNILIDGGGNVNYDIGKNVLLPYLLKNGVSTIDLALITHLHTDHYLGISQLSSLIPVKQIGVFEGNQLGKKEILDCFEVGADGFLYLKAGDRIQIEKDIYLDVLYPFGGTESEYQKILEDETDENKSCLILKLYYDGLTVLMTGDMDTEGERELISCYEKASEIMDVDVLKIGHHGSRFSTSDEFLKITSPDIAIFQVGKNNFGHPHPTVIDKCAKKGIIIYRNDMNGAIVLNKEDTTWHIKTLLPKSMLIEELIKK